MFSKAGADSRKKNSPSRSHQKTGRLRNPGQKSGPTKKGSATLIVKYKVLSNMHISITLGIPET